MREDKRQARGQSLKKRIERLHETRMAAEKEKMGKLQEDHERKEYAEALKEQYFAMQRRNIEEFRLQKAETENLLMIKGPPMNARAYHRNLTKAQMQSYHSNIQ